MLPPDRVTALARDLHLTLPGQLVAVGELPTPDRYLAFVRGEGVYVYDASGRRYLDALAGLFVNQVGHNRTELAEAAAKQAAELAFFPLWSYAHPSAIQLAERLASCAPGDLNRIFFTSGGGEAVDFFEIVGGGIWAAAIRPVSSSESSLSSA